VLFAQASGLADATVATEKSRGFLEKVWGWEGWRERRGVD
jgi:hypothetical protein